MPGGGANNITQRKFADLSLEGFERGAEGDALVYNAFVPGPARWVKLSQKGPITGFQVQIELTDWLGISWICRFLSPKRPRQREVMPLPAEHHPQLYARGGPAASAKPDTVSGKPLHCAAHFRGR